MKAAIRDRYGPPDVVEMRDVEMPIATEDRILVRVAAASVNRADLDGMQPRPNFVRLFIGIGQRDGVRPADIVGAVTGEARIAGEQIGRIEVRDTFTVVEVDSSVAERVIRALNGTTMRGRSLRVDFDRKTAAPPRRGRPARPG